MPMMGAVAAPFRIPSVSMLGRRRRRYFSFIMADVALIVRVVVIDVFAITILAVVYTFWNIAGWVCNGAFMPVIGFVAFPFLRPRVLMTMTGMFGIIRTPMTANGAGAISAVGIMLSVPCLLAVFSNSAVWLCAIFPVVV